MNSLWEYAPAATPSFFLLFALMIKCLLVSFYGCALYFALESIKKLWPGKMGVRAQYYSWYALLLSLPLSGLWWNDFIKLSFYDLFFFANTGPICYVISFVWLFAVLCMLAPQMVMDFKIRKSIKQMEPYIDSKGLKRQAADATGLRPASVHVKIADFIHSPVSYGVFKKNILLPQDYASRYSASELYLLFLHEMAHLKNHDTVKLYFINYAMCFFWPLRILRKKFMRDTEILCDNRVIGIQTGERDAYGELLLKECADKNKVKGFAFSDSYHTIKSRLSALYTCKPEKHRFALFSAGILVVLLAAFFWSSVHRADWLHINTDMEISVLAENIDIGTQVHATAHNLLLGFFLGAGHEFIAINWPPPLENELFRGAYEIADGTLRIDKRAFQQTLTSLGYQEDSTVLFDSSRYQMNMSQAQIKSVETYGVSFRELACVDESDRYLTLPLNNRSFDDLVYLLIAHWL